MSKTFIPQTDWLTTKWVGGWICSAFACRSWTPRVPNRFAIQSWSDSPRRHYRSAGSEQAQPKLDLRL